MGQGKVKDEGAVESLVLLQQTAPGPPCLLPARTARPSPPPTAACTPPLLCSRQDNLKETPVYGGWVDAKGPRYCPSIEDKIVRFADKESHQVRQGSACRVVMCWQVCRCLAKGLACACKACMSDRAATALRSTPFPHSPPPPPHHHHHHTPLAVPPRSFWSQRGAPPPRCTCKASPLGCPSGCSWRCCTACRGSRAARCCGRRTQVRGIPSSRCQHQAWRRRRRRRKGKERKGTDGAVEIWAAASTGPPLPCSRVPFAPDLPPTAPRCTPLLNSAYQLLPAVEYDYLPAHQCHATLETKKVSGLFFSGQLNGTTGES